MKNHARQEDEEFCGRTGAKASGRDIAMHTDSQRGGEDARFPLACTMGIQARGFLFFVCLFFVFLEIRVLTLR